MLVHGEDVVFHVGLGRGDRVHRVGHWVDEVAANEHIDTVVERGREEQSLTALGCAIEQTLHPGQEPEVCHVICLVKHGDLNVIESNMTLAHEIFETAGAGHDDVDARLHCRNLRPLRDATEHRGRGEASSLGQWLNGGLHLRCQLTSRQQDQGARVTRAQTALRGGQARHKREREGDGLATARTTATEDVAASERIRQSGGLDREC